MGSGRGIERDQPTWHVIIASDGSSAQHRRRKLRRSNRSERCGRVSAPDRGRSAKRDDLAPETSPWSPRLRRRPGVPSAGALRCDAHGGEAEGGIRPPARPPHDDHRDGHARFVSTNVARNPRTHPRIACGGDAAGREDARPRPSPRTGGSTAATVPGHPPRSTSRGRRGQPRPRLEDAVGPRLGARLRRRRDPTLGGVRGGRRVGGSTVRSIATSAIDPSSNRKVSGTAPGIRRSAAGISEGASPSPARSPAGSGMIRRAGIVDPRPAFQRDHHRPRR